MKTLVNRASLIGTTGKAPEVVTFDDGKKKVNLSIATNEYYKNRDGETVEKTDWHQVALWGSQAEFAENFITKGQKVAVEGKLNSRSYTDKEGVVRYVTEIVAHEVILLSPMKKAKVEG
ncbi:MAG: single-stranded DNA-binding protein [Flavobacteriia bacterium]|nr:single-stranded DNA-binding protein [Flavobacteriia bacterium]